jgi:PAB-dependent poly(A)-specific ribonuclease subunit 3
MDELNSSFGQLSTGAAEWKPGGGGVTGHSSTTGLQSSDLKALSITEFVPGRAWTDVASSSGTFRACCFYIKQSVFAHPSVLCPAPLEQPFRETVEPAGPSSSDLPSFRALHSMGLPDDLWRHYRGLSLEAARQMDPSDARHKAVPLPYCNAFCLDDAEKSSTSRQSHRSSFFGYTSTTFQVISREDGHFYCLKRFDNVRSVSPKIAGAVSDRWASSVSVMQHPGIVPFYQCFVSQRAVFFVHHFVAGSRTLKERLRGPLAESVLWSCICQLVSAIRAIHEDHLAVRSLRLQNVLSSFDSVGRRLRLRINYVGVVDALEFEARKRVADLQQQDIRDLGFLILSLATGTEVTSNTDASSVGRVEGFLAQNYSPDLYNLAMTLVRRAPHPPSIADVGRTLAIQIMDEHDEAYRALDRMDSSLASEYESGRLLRLLLKLGFVNGRPEFGPNRRWSESGDCYVLTLFRDFGTFPLQPVLSN